ncbi:aldehyde dehydrogenase [Streptomyces cavernae]|uniref:aldehyde dehydrogenase n=1 Tax=Streptomyces cavernae TaxID=2259034 RepID=UPI000FEB6FC9|nr:aldehyde dehydrogenase [Streptomyces cavernae]
MDRNETIDAHSDWIARADRLKFPSWTGDGATFAVTSPRDGQVLTRVPAAGTDHVDRAVAAAREAFDHGPWPRMPAVERREVLLRLASLLDAHRTELALLVSLEMGMPITEAYNSEVPGTAACFRWYAELADKLVDESPQTNDDALALVTRDPAGVVGAVVPWNFPLLMAAWKLAPALAVGCTVVLKPAEQSPLSALRLAELATESGLPHGVLTVVTGDGLAGRALGRHPGVDVLAFTGSTEVGRAFAGYAAESNLKRVWLELGGKSANIILPDAPDLDVAADTAAWGICYNSGQMCTAPSRLLVHRAVADEVVDRVITSASAQVGGDPLDPATTMGPMVSAAQRARVQRHIDVGIDEGARLRHGADQPSFAGGHYVKPVVFDQVTADMRIAREEIFGPVLSVLVFDDANEAIDLANNSEYGLAAAVWTRDLATAHRMSRRLHVGTVWVNCYEEGDLSVPFGGVKQSGYGRDKSRHAIDKYTDLKTVWMGLR